MLITKREKEILQRLYLPNKKIAKKLNISLFTVKKHIHNLFNKFYWVNSRTQLFFKALKHKVINFEEIINE